MNVKHLFVRLGNFVFMWGFVQIILIGAAYFGAVPPFYHAMGGLLLMVVALVMFILSLVGKMGGRIIGLSLLMLVLLAGQGFFVRTEGLQAIVRALHPVFGIGIMFLGRSLAARAEKLA
jgi:hypothetical protein